MTPSSSRRWEPPAATVGRLRSALGLVEPHGQPLFTAAASGKDSPLEVSAAWAGWQSALDDLDVGHLLVYIDGSAALFAGWPKFVTRAGWAAAFSTFDRSGRGKLSITGAMLAPVVTIAQQPGYLGATKPSASVAELTAGTAALGLLRTRLVSASLLLTIATD